MCNKLFSVFLFSCVALTFSFLKIQENTAPIVEIVSPSDYIKVKWNTVVPYNILVSDKEDGNSEFDEINENEVVLTVTYMSDSSQVEKYIKEEVAPRAEMISLIATSNCFTCHKAKDKSIGPSFEEIASRYLPTQKNKEYLSQKITQGSTGAWSDQIMPSQPELEKENIIQILDWVFKNAQDPNFAFYVGTEGAFKTKKRRQNDSNKASYVLHAQYMDHGLSQSGEKSKSGIYSLVLKAEK